MENNPNNISIAKKKSGTVVSVLFRFGLPLAITIALVWYMFTKIDFTQLWATVRHGVDYKWILLAMGVSVFSHVFRALRWRLQLRAIGVNAPLMALCCSIFGTYALNLIFPRLGEVWRCTYISRLEHAPFPKVLGSMVADRLSDTLTVLMLLLLTLVVANAQIIAFMDKYPIGEDIVHTVCSPWFWAGCVLLAAVCVLLVRSLRHTRPVKALLRICADIWGGFYAIVSMKGRGAFVVYTIAIWGCYFLQLYVAFYAFSCTFRLMSEPDTLFGLIPCLVAFVLSSIGMAVPSNGGLGPWNMCIIFGLALYAVPEAQAASMSIVVWSAQTVMLMILGIFTAIYTSKKR